MSSPTVVKMTTSMSSPIGAFTTLSDPSASSTASSWVNPVDSKGQTVPNWEWGVIVIVIVLALGLGGFFGRKMYLRRKKRRAEQNAVTEKVAEVAV
ncbi:hypothetical protein CI109_103959 [Kwoniella shandongensis]|uniref:Uncharacterized protein n=1 Tax=Kwoniella shandongensis TaxID=1734106 RepID=A0A5M6BUV3_9TREE|nr:uncharacterized protein CI109_005586 [Kwoniella shandongensis]KAA5525991.1 hypothetical protein CI109_005586 [Kwoniella shandongensis]